MSACIYIKSIADTEYFKCICVCMKLAYDPIYILGMLLATGSYTL